MANAACKLGTIPRLEVFATGDYRGRVWTVANLDEIVANFQRLSTGTTPLLSPPAVLGHEEDQRFLEATDLPAAGWITALWRENDLLVATATDVPPEVARLIAERAYRKVSAEIYDDFADDFGNRYGLALRRVALLGAWPPQVKRLADIPAVQFGERRPGRRVKIRPHSQARRPGVSYCFSEVIMDRQTMLAMIQQAFPTMSQEFLDSQSDEQLGLLLAGVQVAPPAPAADTPPEPGTQLGDPPAPAADTPPVADQTKQEVAKMGEQVKAINRMLAVQMNEVKRQRVEAFCEQHKAKDLPAELPALKARLMRANAVATVVKFGEKQLSELDAQMAEIEARPAMAKFGEKLPGSLPGVGTGTGATPALTPEKRREMLACTPEGRAILAREESKAK